VLEDFVALPPKLPDLLGVALLLPQPLEDLLDPLELLDDPPQPSLELLWLLEPPHLPELLRPPLKPPLLRLPPLEPPPLARATPSNTMLMTNNRTTTNANVDRFRLIFSSPFLKI